MARKTAAPIKGFREKIAFAEEAVMEMTDASLRAIAFQAIIQRLLQSDVEIIPQPDSLGDNTQKQEKKQTKDRKTTHPKGPKGRIEELIGEGFFDKKRTIGDTQKELENHAWYHKMEDLGPTLVRLVQEKKLRRVKEPESQKGKLIWRYSKW